MCGISCGSPHNPEYKGDEVVENETINESNSPLHHAAHISRLRRRLTKRTRDELFGSCCVPHLPNLSTPTFLIHHHVPVGFLWVLWLLPTVQQHALGLKRELFIGCKSANAVKLATCPGWNCALTNRQLLYTCSSPPATLMRAGREGVGNL